VSYEYNVISNASAKVLYEKIKHLMNGLPDYYFVGSSENASSFRGVTSALEWESDIDLSLLGDNVIFHIHSGSTEILEYLIKSLAKIDIFADFQEL